MENKGSRSWRDVRRQRDPDWDNKVVESKRKRKMEEGACLCRSLSSVLGVPLTKEQEDLRLMQVDKETDIFKVAMNLRDEGKEVDISKLTRDSIVNAQKKAVEFVQAIQSQRDTPAGKAMQNIVFSYEQLTPSQIRQAIKQGGQVVLCEVLHAAHIVPNGEEGNIFRSLSDNGESLHLKEQPTKVLVFRKK